MNAEQMLQLQRLIMGLGREARGSSGVAGLQARIDGIMGDTARLTPEAGESDAALALAERRARILAMLGEEAQRVLDVGRAEVEATLVGLTAVGAEELEARERILRPALGASFERPEVLVNLYRQRYRLPADRVLIEASASAVIDGLGDSDNHAFRDEWNGLLQELKASRGPEEFEALSHLDVLDDLESWRDNVSELVGTGLTLMDPSFEGDRDARAISRAMAESAVNEYETRHASVIGDAA